MSYWEDGTRRSTGNAFDTPTPEPETYQQRRNRLHREECGARLYNEAILATSVGSASMRVTKQFQSCRKMAKTHQNVLVFVKGCWKKASDKCNVGV